MQTTIRAMAILTLLLSAGAARAAATTITVGAATLEVPDGWTAQPGRNGAMTFQRAGKRDELGSILVLASDRPAAQLDAAFREFANGASSNHVEEKYTQKARTPDGWLARKNLASYRVEAKGQSMNVNLTLVALQGQRHFVGLALICPSSDARRANEPAFMKLVNTAKLDDAPAATVPPKTRQDLKGLYARFGITNTINPLGGLSLVQTRDYLDFLPGGFVFRDLPPAAQINAPDAEALRKLKPKDCGTYSLDGSQITLSFPDDNGWIRDETTPFKQDDKGIETDVGYLRLDPQPRGARPEGTWRSFNYTGGDGSTGVSGGVASEHFLTLHADGTYEQQGMTSVAMTVDGGGGSTGIAGNKRKPSARGTYAFDGYTLTLTPAGDGAKPTTMTAYFTSGDGLLALDDTPYTKEEAKKK